jgi:hypothetical protein
MNALEPRNEVTKKELARGKRKKLAAFAAPVVFPVIPFFIFMVLFVLFGSTPPAAAMFFFLGIISAVIAFVIGLITSGVLGYQYQNWLKDVRERMAIDGIKAEEVIWFKNELTTAEKKALKEVEARDLLLADAYRDTLASRLTASRIIKSSRNELLLSKRRQNKLKYLKSENNKEFQEEVKRDIEKMSEIKTEAEQMKIEAESRLQMIEAAARRGDTASAEVALKKLSARSKELPLALESARMHENMRREIEEEGLLED